MKKKCVVCGREFEACGNEKLCSGECRNKRQREHHAAYLEYNRHYEKYQRRRGDSERDYEAQLALELAYWNYLIAKYPGGAKCK